MILVINSNTNSCRFYSYDKKLEKLTLLKELNHPESKLRNIDLASDRPGHYKGDTTARGAYQPHMEPKEIEVVNFAREIAQELEKQSQTKEYKKFILIAPPHMSGRLSKQFSKQVKELIAQNIQKDLINLSEHKLLEFLQEYTKYPSKT